MLYRRAYTSVLILGKIEIFSIMNADGVSTGLTPFLYLEEELSMIFKIKDNLLMRNLTTDDAQEVYKVIDNNRVYLRKLLPWVDATDSSTVVENTISNWIKRHEKGSDLVFGIFMDGKYIGNIGLHDIDRDNKKAIIGYWLAEEFQGRGIMTDCVRALIKYAFDTFKLNTISIHCALGNKKSRAIPKRIGFTESGTLKDGETLYGITHDMVVYSLDRLHLVFPTLEMEREALDYRKEYFDHGEMEINGDGGLDHAENYAKWVDKIRSDPTRDDGVFVPSTTYFAVVGRRIVGTIQVRHRLNEELYKYGGHIGYGVRPSERRKGYAARTLALALEKCRELGIEKVLVTCRKDNIGSARTILKNGGVLENEIVRHDGGVTQRYWIETGGVVLC